ncbi:MAG TPA: alpha/beta hydrolase [Candidatus Binataceae bacterium]|nr:alpha/beta hydrolase [Candidatus Binataceae bacterium]
MASPVAATAAPEPTSKFAAIDGLKLHYLDWGGDPAQGTIVLVHGGSANVHWWDLTAPLLTAGGRVLALDFRGHGHSQWASPPVYGPLGYIKDVEGFLRLIGTPVTLVAHSMGGAVAMWVTAMHPELLQSLVVVDSRGGPPPFWRKLQWRWRHRAKARPRPELPSAQDIIRRFRLHPEGTNLSNEALAELGLKSAIQLPNGKWAFCFDPQTRGWRDSGKVKLPSVRKIAVPTLILRGAQSSLLSARRARWLRRKIKGSVLEEIPRAYHHVPLDNPDDTAAAILEFIRSVRAGRSSRE